MPAEELRRRVHGDVGADILRPLQVGGRHRVVDDERHAGAVRDLGHGPHVEHLGDRVRDGLGEERPRLGPDRRRPGVGVVLVDEGDLDAPVGERVLQQVDRAAVELAGGDDVLALLREREQRERDRGLTGCDARGGDAAFELGDPALEHQHGRVRGTAVDVAVAAQREQIACLAERAELERVRLVDRRDGGVLGDTGR